MTQLCKPYVTYRPMISLFLPWITFVMMPGGFFIQTKIPGRVTEDATNRNFIVLLLSVWEVGAGGGVAAWRQ